MAKGKKKTFLNYFHDAECGVHFCIEREVAHVGRNFIPRNRQHSFLNVCFHFCMCCKICMNYRYLYVISYSNIIGLISRLTTNITAGNIKWGSKISQDNSFLCATCKRNAPVLNCCGSILKNSTHNTFASVQSNLK